MKIIRKFEEKLASRIKEDLKFMQVVVGPRQIGKTTALKNIAEFYKKNGREVVFASADNLGFNGEDWLYTKWQNAVELGSKTLLIIDEIQKIPNWSEVVKKLFEEHYQANLKIVLLGSASLQIQKGLKESLAGRYELIRATHWNFYEMNKAFNFNFTEYLMYGGYPGAAEFISDSLRWKNYVSDSIVENVLSKDLVNVSEIRNPALLRQLFFIVMSIPAQEISFQKLVGQLQDKGAVATIKHYLELLEGAYLIKLLYKYSGKELKMRTSSPKILPLDPALISTVNSADKITQDSSWRGRVFESVVGSILTQIADEIYYWREGKFEVDFVIRIKDKLIAVEVKSGALKRLDGLSKFKEKYPESILLVIDYEKGKSLLNVENYDDFRLNPELLLSL